MHSDKYVYVANQSNFPNTAQNL